MSAVKTKSKRVVDNDLVDVFYVAELFGVHPQTVRVWTRKKKLPFIPMGHHTARYRKRDIEKVLAKRTVKAAGIE
jgi:predicted site-specific integrase-resolvase